MKTQVFEKVGQILRLSVYIQLLEIQCIFMVTYPVLKYIVSLYPMGCLVIDCNLF